MNKVYLSLGSNIGDSFYYLMSAISMLDKLEQTKVNKISKFYSTKPWGNLNQDDFINCCIEIDTKLLPYQLLKEINSIERLLGRKREVFWGPRTIDIDIIFYKSLKIETDKLTIPHKFYKKRNFVLIPLIDIYYNKKNLYKYINKNEKLQIFEYKKKIGISSCLLGYNVKYNGGNNFTDLFVNKLKLDYLKLCPETLSGLKSPRVPSEILGKKVFSKIGEDLTEEFELGAKKTLELIKKNNVEMVIMKSKSPSCGKDLVYDGKFEKKLVEGNGITVDLLLKNNINVISY
ncbi:MAG: 2-amino-4-hydroxy-6-hydroxymethyldihydropteridine diphosphokinase [Fusobacteriaceae bacterium]|nr:2-amino-4-hydroxy-6-hydroxymethyldihydropteridine diphosphokinase [Fusobacteriaceae bacterium]MBN2838348.1 2-amino-4-hydroxy-6-hydroxymethyldihydropteridine diphosphokinase [Fusobacteriaceae bacterium]